MSTEYVSQDEIDALGAIMKQMVKNKKQISGTKKQTVEIIQSSMNSEIRTAENELKKAIEEAQEEYELAIEAAKEKADQAVKAAENDAEKQLKQSEKKILALRRYVMHLPLLRQIYYEAPDDVFELIVSKCSGYGSRGLNALRTSNKRLKKVVEACTIRLVNEQGKDGPDSLPVSLVMKCKRLEVIQLHSHNLRSLEGCPSGLKGLKIDNARHLSDLSPLSSCSMMESLDIYDCSITDISVVSSMPLLTEFGCIIGSEKPSIKDLSPLSSCPRLKKLVLSGNKELKDLSTLSSCSALERLFISCCPVINSLAPLSPLANLKELSCRDIDPQTSLLPLASCIGLKRLFCSPNAVDLEVLKRRRPELVIKISGFDMAYDSDDEEDG